VGEGLGEKMYRIVEVNGRCYIERKGFVANTYNSKSQTRNDWGTVAMIYKGPGQGMYYDPKEVERIANVVVNALNASEEIS
jgi:hypothetical protein